MPDILQKILATKREEVAAAKSFRSLTELQALARDQPAPRDFIGAIRAKHEKKQPAIIAEIKKASPSAGVFRDDFDPAVFASSYERHGAACLSVLTDSPYFQGKPEDLQAARAACRLPVLRKDFMVDCYQVFEARAMGADCILLISGALSLALMQELEGIAHELGMVVLVESHNAAQLEDALKLQTPLIGINNRDLKRFVVDISITLELQSRITADRIVITESGVSSAEIVKKLSDAGVNTYLIGGAFMKHHDPGEALTMLFANKNH